MRQSWKIPAHLSCCSLRRPQSSLHFARVGNTLAEGCLGLRSAARPIGLRCQTEGSRNAAARDEGGASEQDQGGGGVGVMTKRPADADRATDAARTQAQPSEFKGNWRVLLHRDEWITFDYCSDVLVQVIPTLTRKKVLPSEIQRGEDGGGPRKDFCLSGPHTLRSY